MLWRRRLRPSNLKNSWRVDGNGTSPVSGKTVVAKFDGGLLSSDGGVLLLCEVEQRLEKLRPAAHGTRHGRSLTRNTVFSRPSSSTARDVSSPQLRPAKRPSGKKAERFLRRFLRYIRANWPRTEILLRADSHYCVPETIDFCRANGLDFASSRTPRRAISAARTA